MTRTCWGESRGITRLQEQLFERMEAAPKVSTLKQSFLSYHKFYTYRDHIPRGYLKIHPYYRKNF